MYMDIASKANVIFCFGPVQMINVDLYLNVFTKLWFMLHNDARYNGRHECSKVNHEGSS